MRRLIGFVFLCLATNVLAQPEVTSNEFVAAVVADGFITIRQAPGTGDAPYLSSNGKSFLAVMIADKVYTNNMTGYNIDDDPRLGEQLGTGLTLNLDDTVRTIWTKGGCSIVQDVFPATLEASGQIVMRWRLRNNGSAPIRTAMQFLLDMSVAQPSNQAFVLTQHGYKNTWRRYTVDSIDADMPSFFATFQNRLPNAPTFDPGLTGVGYTRDVNYQLGLKSPSSIVIGDWEMPFTFSLVDNLWGTSPNVPWGEPSSNAAILYQWEEVTVAGGETVELGSTSYGTSEFGTCTGQILGLVSFPRRFKWNASSYTPDTAIVDIYAFNVYPASGPPSENTYMTLMTGPNLHIVEPGQKQQTDPFLIPQSGVGVASWKIVADKVTDCTEDLTSWIKFTGESSLSDTGAIFVNSGVGDTCEHALVIECVPAGDVAADEPDDIRFELSDNPASHRTTLTIDLPMTQSTAIRVVDMSGKEVYSQHITLRAGVNELPLSTAGFSEGVYYVIVEIGGRQFARKLQIVR